MDKIFVEDWMNVFSEVDQEVIHHQGNFSEVMTTLNEPGLASSRSWMVKVPGMTATLVSLVPEGKLLLQASGQNEYIQSAFMLRGLIHSHFNKKPVVSQGNSHAFQYSFTLEERHQICSKDFEAFHISYETDFFRNLIQRVSARELEILGNMLEKKEQFLVPPSSMPLQVRMNEIIYAIRNCSFNALTKSIFMEAKMLELFALQLEQMTRIDLREKEMLNKADKEKLRSMKEFIEKNYLQPLSLAQLGSLFALNEFKLKKGYKLLFGVTVFGHIYQLRMQWARQLLSQHDMTVSEVADAVGYANVSSFSAEFKKRFGYSPSKERN